MSRVQIGQAEYEVDFYDLAVMDAFDEAETAVEEASARQEVEKSGAYLRRCCQVLMDSIDRVVGVGASAEAFGASVHWNEVLGGWQALRLSYYDTMMEATRQMNETNQQHAKQLQAMLPKEPLAESLDGKRKAVRIS